MRKFRNCHDYPYYYHMYCAKHLQIATKGELFGPQRPAKRTAPEQGSSPRIGRRKGIAERRLPKGEAMKIKLEQEESTKALRHEGAERHTLEVKMKVGAMALEEVRKFLTSYEKMHAGEETSIKLELVSQ